MDVSELKVSIENFYFDKNRILSNVSLSFKKNVTYFLVGENGNGKTTFLNIICGNYTKREDNDFKVFYKEKPINYKNKDYFFTNYVNYITQDALIFDDLSTLENLLLPFDKKDKIKAINILKDLGLDNVIYSKAIDLSKGEKQRLNFARCLYDLKEIILLDEITSYLDKESEEIILNKIKEISKNRIVIIVSHKENYDYFENYEIIKFSNSTACIYKKLYNEQKITDSDNDENLKEKIKSSIFHKFLSNFKSNKIFSLILVFSSLIFSAILIFFSSLTDTFSQQNLRSLTFDSYLELSNGIVLTEKINTNCFSFNNDFYDVNFSHSKNTRYRISGLAFIDNTSNLDEINLINNDNIVSRYPTSINEIILSDLSYNFYVKNIMDSNGCAFDVANNILISQGITIDNVTYFVTGIYEAKDYEIFNNLFEFNLDNLFLENSLGFMINTAFTYGNSENVNKVNLYICDKQCFDKDKSNDVIFIYDDNAFDLLFYSKNGEIDNISNGITNSTLFIVSAVALFSFMFSSYIGFTIGNKRKYILLRICGENRDFQTRNKFIFFTTNIFIFSIFGFLIGLISIVILQNVINNSLLYNTIYFSFSWIGILIILIYLILNIIVSYIVFYIVLSPKDISKRILEVKKK